MREGSCHLYMVAIWEMGRGSLSTVMSLGSRMYFVNKLAFLAILVVGTLQTYTSVAPAIWVFGTQKYTSTSWERKMIRR